MTRRPHKAHMNTPVSWEERGIKPTTIRELHESGQIERVRIVTFYDRVRPEYCADVVIWYNDKGKEVRSSYFPIYKHTFHELMNTGKYDQATGERITDG